MFLGISLIIQNYINPAIDTIKKKGIVSALFKIPKIYIKIRPDTMNATLLDYSNSAAESFIIAPSIFFYVPYIGIQTAVKQYVLSSLIIQGYFNKLAMSRTRIDWWITKRDSVLHFLYLSMQRVIC